VTLGNMRANGLRTLAARVPQSAHDRGYATTREQAMAAFKAAWITEIRRLSTPL
jgi:hypothetical protein